MLDHSIDASLLSVGSPYLQAMRSAKRHLHSYCFNAAKDCEVFWPENTDQLSEFLHSNPTKTFSLMGAGNSFGDVFLPANHSVLDLTGLDRIIEFDESSQLIRLEGGVHVGELQQFLLQRGYYLPSCSGSINNTVAGDFASNINGKDSWKMGHYARNVEGLKMVDVSGQLHVVQSSDTEIFNALAGGLGLIGIVVELTLKVRPVKGSMLSVSRLKSKSLEETVAILNDQCNSENDYAYAWVDSLATGSNAGRGIIESARFIEGVDPDVSELRSTPNSVFGLPDDIFWNTYRTSWNLAQKMGVDRPVFKIVNSMRYSLLRDKTEAVETGYFNYQFPMMSTLPNWNKRFLNQGMQEIQCIFSKSVFVEAVLELWKIMKDFGAYPELAAIRKHKVDEGFLSFAADGFSTTLNYDNYGKSRSHLSEMERRLISTIINFGGKVYMSKFPYLLPEEFRSMYPEYQRFVDQKKNFDPENRLVSAASNRLFSGLL